MPESEQSTRLRRFGVFELDAAAGELRRSGRLVALSGQPMRVLVHLVERAGAIVTREDLQREIWGGDTYVDFDAGLSTCINQIRAALGDRAASPRFVETVPRRGYRFIAPVENLVGNRDRRSGIRNARGSRFPVAGSRIVIAAAGLLAILGGLLYPIAKPSTTAAIPIVVVPVEIDSTRKDLEPVSLSMTDALIGMLVREAGPRARVASPMAIAHLRGASASLKDISDIGAEYFVHVSLRSMGGPILVHSKLAHITGWILWTSDQTLPFAELERDQLRIAAELARRVALEILPASTANRRSPLPSAIADYAQARSDLDAGRIGASLTAFEKAHRIDGQHPASLAGLAHAIVESAWNGTIDRGQACERATAAAHRALALDPDNARAVLALGAVAWLRDRQADAALTLFRRAEAIDSSLASAREWQRRVQLHLDRPLIGSAASTYKLNLI